MLINSKNYICLNNSQITNLCAITGGIWEYKLCGAKPIKINMPFELDEDIARIAGMIMDGSINKHHYSIMFAQKKDVSKVKEFAKIVQRRFGVIPKIRDYKGTSYVYFHNKNLGIFLNMNLDIHKSDEEARIPYWIWKSPKSVIKEYLRYAFAMEGSVDHYYKTSEVKFHSVDLSYLIQLKKLLFTKFGIKSRIQEYYIKNYGWKYYLCISKHEYIGKFGQIGFALESHQKRLDNLISSFKNMAWEITLVAIFYLNKRYFTAKELNEKIPYLCINSIFFRLRELIRRNYVVKEKIGYSLTEKGYKKASSLKNQIKNTKLRTCPKENEKKILEFLKIKKESYRNEIAKELRINSNTIRDTLRRLVKKKQVKLVRVDKFQSKWYSVKNQ